VTITYTVGPSSSQHVITTTYEETSTETVIKTVYLTKPYGTPSSVVSAAAESTPDSTTTISTTSTTTVYLTVYPETASATVVSPTGTAGECAAPVYVTITAQETVTVTAGSYETPSESAVAAAETSTSIVYVYPSSAESSVVGESTAAAVPTSLPLYPTAPYGNGTYTKPTYAPSSGFFTYVKPTGTAPHHGHHPHSSGTDAPVQSPTGGYGGYAY